MTWQIFISLSNFYQIHNFVTLGRNLDTDV